MASIWNEDIQRRRFPTLRGSIKTDVLIVGGGMAGVLCAYMLREAGVDCILAEATRIGGGVSGNTTAKITLQHGLLYDKLIKTQGVEQAKRYLQAQHTACMAWEQLCVGIDCDYEKKDAYVYSLKDRAIIENEVAALHRLGMPAIFCETLSLPLDVAGAVRLQDQAQFHPLKFLYAIAEGLPIYEHTKVTQLMPHKTITDHGEIAFKKLIIATHFPINNKHGGYFLKLYQHRSYVLALDGAPSVDGMYVDENAKGLSFRGYRNQLLLGGGAHRTGKHGGCWQELEAFARYRYPSTTVAHRWATQDCMTLDGVPYIGRYAKSLPDVYVATGFNKWGMTSSMVAAMVLTDLVQGRENRFASVFNPARSMWHPQLAINAAESLIGLLTPTAPRCPHLGCALKYNAAEHSWDCPCHGSRFSESGKLINNPATDDKTM